MRIARLTTAVILALVSVSLQGQQTGQKITLIGKLVRAMAIGGESTGWILELESATKINGKEVKSIQISFGKPGRLEKLENKRVKVTGKLSTRQGIETGEQTVLDASSIK